MSERKYYVQHTRTVVGNCAIWWGKENRGFVCDLNDAAEFSEKEALDIQGSRGTDLAIPVDVVRPIAHLHVRADGALQQAVVRWKARGSCDAAIAASEPPSIEDLARAWIAAKDTNAEAWVTWHAGGIGDEPNWQAARAAERGLEDAARRLCGRVRHARSSEFDVRAENERLRAQVVVLRRELTGLRLSAERRNKEVAALKAVAEEARGVLLAINGDDCDAGASAYLDRLGSALGKLPE